MRLVIFDADGTLVDSQAIIHAAMCESFKAHDRPAPAIEETRSIIGLTLNQAIARMLGRPVDDEIEAMSATYKSCYLQLQKKPEMHAMLYEGIASAIDILHAQPHTLLAIATGKSRRGLDNLIETHGLARKLVAWRSADDCPSKPHPAMILECCERAGCSPEQAVMVGDSSYDMEMAVAARSLALGVSWGYQSVATLNKTGANAIVEHPHELPSAIDAIFESRAK